MDLEVFLGRVQPEGLRRASEGGFVVRCPAHEDHAASLSIAEGDDGRVLLHCFAGCTAEEIACAYGLKVADLFPDTAPGEGDAALCPVPATVQPRPGCTLAD